MQIQKHGQLIIILFMQRTWLAQEIKTYQLMTQGNNLKI